jgi:hypothetical protein
MGKRSGGDEPSVFDPLAIARQWAVEASRPGRHKNAQVAMAWALIAIAEQVRTLIEVTAPPDDH